MSDEVDDDDGVTSHRPCQRHRGRPRPRRSRRCVGLRRILGNDLSTLATLVLSRLSYNNKNEHKMLISFSNQNKIRLLSKFDEFECNKCHNHLDVTVTSRHLNILCRRSP